MIYSKGDYYLEIIHPTLFDRGHARIYRYAHPDSLSPNHLLYSFNYEQFEDAHWQFDRLTDPVETIYGEF